MRLKKIFGTFLTVLGVILLLVTAMAFLQEDGAIWGIHVEGFKILVPLVLGFTFFGSGIGLLKSIS